MSLLLITKLPVSDNAMQKLTPLTSPNPSEIIVRNNNVPGTNSASVLMVSDSVVENSGTINLNITDASAAGISHSLVISGIPSGAVVDSVIAIFTISHPFLPDAVINLEAPNGDIVNLAAFHDNADDPGYSDTRITSDNAHAPLPSDSGFAFSFTYRDDGKTQTEIENDPNNEGINPSPAITTTEFADLFSTLNSANGNWTIRVYDVFTGDVGTLIEWSIKIRYTLATPVPVTLLSFGGYRENNYNLLKWKTVFEQNNLGFQIERSDDGISYSSIGFVNSLATNGYSISTLEYSFIDNYPLGKSQYYRLRQKDFDGNSKLSNIIHIKSTSPTAFSIINLFPNPVTSKMDISINALRQDEVRLEVFDIYGKISFITKAFVEKGSNTVSIDVSSIPSGSYLLKVISKSSAEADVRKLIKQ